MNKIRNEIGTKVYNFKTKYEEGFIKSEIDTLLKEYPNINIDKFDSALFGITCFRKNGEEIIYPIDIISAMVCGIENRGLTDLEWD